MVQPSHDIETCAFCQGPARPFGRLKQRFVLGDFGPLCLSCARRELPDDVAEAEAYEMVAEISEKEKN